MDEKVKEKADELRFSTLSEFSNLQNDLEQAQARIKVQEDALIKSIEEFNTALKRRKTKFIKILREEYIATIDYLLSLLSEKDKEIEELSVQGSSV